MFLYVIWCKKVRGAQESEKWENLTLINPQSPAMILDYDSLKKKKKKNPSIQQLIDSKLLENYKRLHDTNVTI